MMGVSSRNLRRASASASKGLLLPRACGCDKKNESNISRCNQVRQRKSSRSGPKIWAPQQARSSGPPATGGRGAAVERQLSHLAHLLPLYLSPFVVGLQGHCNPRSSLLFDAPYVTPSEKTLPVTCWSPQQKGWARHGWGRKRSCVSSQFTRRERPDEPQRERRALLFAAFLLVVVCVAFGLLFGHSLLQQEDFLAVDNHHHLHHQGGGVQSNRHSR
jgi:hypothetical protein